MEAGMNTSKTPGREYTVQRESKYCFFGKQTLAYMDAQVDPGSPEVFTLNPLRLEGCLGKHTVRLSGQS